MVLGGDLQRCGLGSKGMLSKPLCDIMVQSCPTVWAQQERTLSCSIHIFSFATTNDTLGSTEPRKE
jgi:hypothetical protein